MMANYVEVQSSLVAKRIEEATALEQAQQEQSQPQPQLELQQQNTQIVGSVEKQA